MRVANRIDLTSARHGIRSLGEVRDGLLVIGAVIYTVGYAVWAVYSQLFNLGPVRPLDAQYFAAGATAILISVTGVSSALFLQKLSRFVLSLYRTRSRRFRWGLLIVGMGFAALIGRAATPFIVERLIYPTLGPLNLAEIYVGGLTVVGIAGVVLLCVYLVGLTGPLTRKLIDRALIGYGIPLAISLLGIYVRVIFPHIPQVVGGGRLPTARIVLSTEDLSPQLIKRLVVTSPVSKATLETGEVRVVSISPDALIVITVDGARIQIERKHVSAVVWTRE